MRPSRSTDPTHADPVSASGAPDAGEIVRQLEAAHAQLESMTEQLIRSQRLAALGTLTAVVAHEFNNLLTPVGSYAQFALRTVESGKDDPELVRKALQRAHSGAAKAERLCSSILGLARGEGKCQSVAVVALIEEVCNIVGRDLEKGRVRLSVDVAPEIVVQGDVVQLEQVLLNLAINARQAMSERGGDLRIRAERSGERVRLTVSDTGPGIDPANLARVFEPFFTTKATSRSADQPRGTGLGLAICRQIVQRNDGTIEVQSQPGAGTSFVLDLPAAA